MQKWLFSSIDNCSLIIFRIVFGFLITVEAWGAIGTGWVRRVLIEPKFTFNFIHLDFLQPIPGNGMYVYFFVMGVCGVLIMLGYKYTVAMISFTVLWAGVYLMQKSAYNNHYYLLFIVNMLMCFLPANKNLSLDTKFGITNKTDWMPAWVKWLIIGQLLIVYTYASAAKFYPDWLDTTVAANIMRGKKDYFLVGEMVQQKWAHYVITYFGIIFDGLIIPALLFKPTRKYAFSLAVFFHLYNSIFLGIGIFPYLALGFCVFFFEPRLIRKLFYPKSQNLIDTKMPVNQSNSGIIVLIGVWLFIQAILPLRHWIIPGDVLWTEEGHRLSWRMMLRSKGGRNTFYIKEEGQKKQKVNLKDYLTKKQIRAMTGKPDMIWQFAQHLKNEYAVRGKKIEVFVKNKIKVNRKGERKSIIDPKIDLANAKWNYWGHNDWVLIDQ